MVRLVKRHGEGKAVRQMKRGAWEIKLNGVVQGVGFRPFVYRLAREYGVKGWVLNSAAGLTVWAEGEEGRVREFYRTMVEDPPPLAKITRHRIVPQTVEGWTEFVIRRSEEAEQRSVLVSPDVATCPDCLRELFDPLDRRYLYPFINCTNCGPRFTIIRDVPYDRPKTTMASFPMCPSCAKEYTSPDNRRFHAQPNACPVCGPRLVLIDGEGKQHPGLGREFLRQGKIIAVKGLGGFHLVCNALDGQAVRELRRRKHREAKPFAVMCRDLAVVRKYCRVADKEAELLRSAASPIVILARRREQALPDEAISPRLNTLGVMLPYTPLHHLLFGDGLEMLVMTSANISDEPLITDNHEALTKLRGIADYFLLHDREIFNRCDDTVAAVVEGEVHIYRRARGYVPLPVDLEQECRPILACGGEMKNTFCLVKGRQAFLSQHLGDLNHSGNYRQFLDAIPRLQKIAGLEPTIVAYDLHPDYMASRYARDLTGMIQVGVQHHHAHLAACMAENHLQGPVLGVVCDGTGYGTDGAIWGFEFFGGDYGGFERLAHLDYLPLPGGDATVRRPSRMAFTYLYCLLGERGLEAAERYLTDLTAEEKGILQRQLETGFNTVPTSSCGRLFDAVSAILGVCTRVSYEGQAAVELEAVSDPCAGEVYPYTIQAQTVPYRLTVGPLLAAILADLQQGTDKRLIAGRFHATVASMIVEMLCRLRQEKGLNRVALSGGTFQNRLLFRRLLQDLKGMGFAVYYHRKVPANDGGISLGQAIIANEVVKRVSGGCGKNHRHE